MSSKLCLKLLIDTKAQRVLFAEAGKEVVDFLFSLMAMPMGSIIKRLTKNHMVGCIASVYESLRRLDDTYFQPRRDKGELLNPRVMSAHPTQATLFSPPSTGPTAVRYYKCFYGHNYVTNASRTPCPSCRVPMTTEAQYVDPVTKEVVVDPAEGYVRGVVTYMVMDDLTVTPMSAISSITLLNKFQVTDVSTLQEKTVALGMEEGLKLLKASFQSTTVLTDIFLAQKKHIFLAKKKRGAANKS